MSDRKYVVDIDPSVRAHVNLYQREYKRARAQELKIYRAFAEENWETFEAWLKAKRAVNPNYPEA